MSQLGLDGIQGLPILVIGDVMLDRYLWGDVSRVSPEAPIPIVLTKKKTAAPGGAANVAHNLSGLECRPILMGLCGDDESGERLAALLVEARIEARLQRDPGRVTSSKTRILAQGQQLLRVDEEVGGAPPGEFLDRLLRDFEEVVTGVRAVILSDYGKGVLQPRVCRTVIERCRALALPVLVDPKWREWDRYAGASCVTPNAVELAAVASGPTGTTEELIREAEAVRQRYDLDHLLVTRGSAGMALFQAGEEPLLVGTRAREVFDVSGAGDTVLATLAAGVGAGWPWAKAAQVSNAAAGVVVGKLGTQPVLLSELRAALAADGRAGRPKHFSLSEVVAQVRIWQASGERIVFTNGCFDILHPGHIKLIEAAAREGSKLIVGLNSDASVRALKGKDRPILGQEERAALLAALAEVDMVILFDEETPLKLISELRPDVLVKGSDYRLEQVVGRDVVESYGGRVALVDLQQGLSTTSIIQRITSSLTR
ncbi:MAG: D-glycero-beta-D-manno-heptose-7-phosphate kinase [Deltaproteobacteria bacterium]|nr:D-glycero-beta-D-manno-heptose-7-phosphate kinase [Deltaproteobacteria bacterium]